MNKSQGEIIKYKQAYEGQRERRKELEAKLTQTAEDASHEAIQKYQNNTEESNKRETLYQSELAKQYKQIKQLEDQLLKLKSESHVTT